MAPYIKLSNGKPLSARVIICREHNTKLERCCPSKAYYINQSKKCIWSRFCNRYLVNRTNHEKWARYPNRAPREQPLHRLRIISILRYVGIKNLAVKRVHQKYHLVQVGLDLTNDSEEKRECVNLLNWWIDSPWIGRGQTRQCASIITRLHIFYWAQTRIPLMRFLGGRPLLYARPKHTRSALSHVTNWVEECPDVSNMACVRLRSDWVTTQIISMPQFIFKSALELTMAWNENECSRTSHSHRP